MGLGAAAIGGALSGSEAVGVGIDILIFAVILAALIFAVRKLLH